MSVIRYGDTSVIPDDEEVREFLHVSADGILSHEQVLLCPVCECPSNHYGVPRSVSRFRDRADYLHIPVLCEGGHGWTIVIMFYKGSLGIGAGYRRTTMPLDMDIPDSILDEEPFDEVRPSS